MHMTSSALRKKLITVPYMGSVMFYAHADGCSLSMPRMFYCSMHMPIGWEGLCMATDGCSV